MRDLTYILLHTAGSVVVFSLIVASGYGAVWVFERTGALELFVVPPLLCYVWAKVVEDYFYMSFFPAHQSPESRQFFKTMSLLFAAIVLLVAIAHRFHLG